jgi:hypothetical protein
VLSINHIYEKQQKGKMHTTIYTSLLRWQRLVSSLLEGDFATIQILNFLMGILDTLFIHFKDKNFSH